MEYILLSAPMHINWNYTYKCNFNCIHCYSRDRELSSEMTLEQKKIVAENIIRNNVFNVNLGGGEPLLSDDCFEIIELLSSNDVRVNLSTNGWKTSDEVIKRLKEVGLGGVAISIDHLDEKIHDEGRNKDGSLKEAFKSTEKYIESGIEVFFSTTITSRNFEVIEEIVAKGVELGVKGIDFKRLKTTGNAALRDDLILSSEQERRLFELIPRLKREYPLKLNFVYREKRVPGIDSGCPCGKTSLAIMNNGDISPCVYNYNKIGNALVDDIHEIWCNSPELNYLRENFTCLGLPRKGEG